MDASAGLIDALAGPLSRILGVYSGFPPLSSRGSSFANITR